MDHQGILCKPPGEVAAPPAPPAAERQAEWELVLNLKPGELAPTRVSLRKQLRELAESQAIKADLAQDDSLGPAPARLSVARRTGGTGRGKGPGEV
jgi:hypothetical protein